MKTLLAVTLTAALLAAPTMVVAQDQPSKDPDYKSDSSKVMILGKVKEKSDKELTITQTRTKGETKVTLTDSTTYKKGVETAKVDDVQVGSQVLVQAKKGDSGNEAVEIRIMDKAEKPAQN